MYLESSQIKNSPQAETPKRGRSGLFFSIFVLLIALAGLYFVYDVFIKNPCDLPVSYSIGEVDARFKITKQDVIKQAQDAADRWNKQLNENVLNYDENADLKINLIYDERQAKIDKITAEIGSLDNSGNAIESLRMKVEDQISEYKIDLDKYNYDVSYWNSQGGAPEPTFTQLKNQKVELEQRRNQINTSAELLDKQINLHNSNLDQLNEEINSDKNKIITQGMYYPGSIKIDIFTFGNKEELRLVSMHELGHALSLDHDTQETSLMFPVLEKQDLTNPTLSNEDIQIFQQTCKSKSGALKNLVKNVKTLLVRSKESIN